jgi:hypothetical protein
MIESELIQACDVNAAAALRYFTRSGGGDVTEAAGVLLAASTSPYCGSFHNAAVRIDHWTDPASVIDRADEFFGSRGRGYVLWAERGVDADLEKEAAAAGMALRRPAAGAPVMLVTAPLPSAEPARDVSLVPVTTADQAAAFAGIVAAAYTAREEPRADASAGADDSVPGVRTVDGQPQPPGASLAMFSQPAALWATETYAVIARLNGEPVSCAVLYQADGVGGVYWVSTVKAARRRGLAELVTTAVTNEGFRRGARLVTLQASSMGAPLYRRMGFVEVGRCRRYVRTLPAVEGLARDALDE